MSTSFETHLIIDAPPELVWEVLTDFSAFGDWNPMLRHASGRLEPGARLSLHLRRLSFPVSATLLAVEPLRHLRWAGGAGPLLHIEHYFRLEPHAQGTFFTHGERFEGLLGPTIARLARIDERQYDAYNHQLAVQTATRAAD